MVADERTWNFLLTDDGAGRADFEQLATEQGWPLVEQQDGDRRSVPFQQVRLTADRTTWITYVEDPVSERRFIAVKGPAAGGVGLALGRTGRVRTGINVLRLAREARSEAERMDAAMELAVMFKAPEPEVLNLLKAYYAGAGEPLRRRIIKALGYRGWPEGVDLLDQIADSDSSPELRGHAENMARLWREHHAAPRGS